ncbi:MAG: YciI-like protein [Sporichthyaceae bacterium]
MTHVLLEYTLAPDYLERRGEYRAAHLALLEPAAAAGDLVLAGALPDPFDKALFVWREGCEAAAEAFAAADPYVTHGLIESWQIRTWNTVIGSAFEA